MRKKGDYGRLTDAQFDAAELLIAGRSEDEIEDKLGLPFGRVRRWRSSNLRFNKALKRMRAQPTAPRLMEYFCETLGAMREDAQ